jgi:hypothetical protein
MNEGADKRNWFITPIVMAIIAVVVLSTMLTLVVIPVIGAPPDIQVTFTTSGISNPATIAVDWQIYQNLGENKYKLNNTGTVTFRVQGQADGCCPEQKIDYPVPSAC